MKSEHMQTIGKQKRCSNLNFESKVATLFISYPNSGKTFSIIEIYHSFYKKYHVTEFIDTKSNLGQ